MSYHQIDLPSPAGEPAVAPHPPAVRPSTLEGGAVVLLDNGQAAVEVPNYGAVLDGIDEHLRSSSSPLTIHRMLADLVRLEQPDIDALSQQIVELRPSAVIIGLCHAGVTAPSVVLAGSLERSGVPCALVCTPLGGPFAELLASYDVPAVPRVVVPELRDVSEEDRGERWQDLLDEVLRAVTSAPRDSDRRVAPQARGPIVFRLPRQARDIESVVDAGEEYWEQLLASGLNDGLPVVPPTPQRVEATLEAGGLDAEEVLVSAPTPNRAPVTVGKLAIVAVLAGCRPEYFPVVVAAARAMNEPEFRFYQTAITSHPSGIATVISGPIVDELAINASGGCLGPGFRANATIGRAVNSIPTTITGASPSKMSLTTFGSAAQFTYCFGELRDPNPWPLRHAEVFGDTTSCVTILKCESPHNVMTNLGASPEGLLSCAASAMSTLATTAIRWPGEQLVLINPRQANLLADAGFSRDDVQRYLFESARVPAASLAQADAEALLEQRGLASDLIPVARSPEDFIIVVAGRTGHQMMVAPSWGMSRALTVRI